MLGPFIKYWTQPFQKEYRSPPLANVSSNKTKSIVTIAFLSALTALFQSAGGFLPGLGYLISPLATAPIVLATFTSIRSGLTAYALSSLLLLLIQPTELIIFPFTTGLLGIALGFFIARSKNRLQIVLFSAISLWSGILLVLYAFRFPLLGPSIAKNLSIDTTIYVFLFCLLYSMVWMEISLRLLARLTKYKQG